jgi:hypothetical protein
MRSSDEGDNFWLVAIGVLAYAYRLERKGVLR